MKEFDFVEADGGDDYAVRVVEAEGLQHGRAEDAEDGGVGSDAEAPEDAIREEEGPESWEEWKTEAPDAGRGGYPSIERDFTHGRSRS